MAEDTSIVYGPITSEQFDSTPEAARCLKCHTINLRKRCMVKCNRCQLWAHATCVKVTKTTAGLLPRWCCKACIDGNINEEARPLNESQNPNTIEDLSELISRWNNSIRVLKRIPKAARICVAEAYAQVLKEAREHKSLISWGRLFGFAFYALRLPNESGERSCSLATIIRNQTNRFLGSEGLPSWEEEVAKKKHNRKTSNEEDFRRRVEAKLFDGDVRGAVRLIASEDTIATATDETIAALRSKHPHTPENIDLPPPPDGQHESVIVSEEQIWQSITSFSPGSSAGLDGIRPIHLKDLLGRTVGAAAETLKKELTSFVNMILGGSVPDFAVHVFYGGRLCALAKKDGGIRPVAVGNTLRRLAAKSGLRPMSAQIGGILKPIQLGYGVNGGCEAATHAVRRYIEGSKDKRVLLKIDMKNAFNCLRRDKFLNEARQHMTGLYKLLWQAYSTSTNLYYGKEMIPSATGLQQGDPAGPALFSLGVNSLARSTNSELKVWYLDDATLGGTSDVVLADIQILIPKLLDLGLQINDAKCELIALNHTDAEKQETLRAFKVVMPNISLLKREKYMLLGAPLSTEAIKPAITSKKADLERLGDRLSLLDPHPAFSILKNCLALPKLQYILRTSPVYGFDELLQELDDSIQRTVIKLTNVDMTTECWDQAVLPVSMGGLGMRKVSDIAAPAFISSLHSTSSLVSLILSSIPELGLFDGVERVTRFWQERSGIIELPAEEERSKQKIWDMIAMKQKHQLLLSNVDQLSRARILAASCHEAGQWLHTFPIPSLGTYLDKDSLRISIAMRVGAKVCETHKCRCGRRTDMRGHHPLSCNFGSGRLPRHAALNDIIRRALQTAGLPSILEPPGLSRDDGKRPDGMTTFPFKMGRSLVWDATCVNTFGVANIIPSAIRAGTAASDAEDRKRNKYRDLAGQHIFEPLAFETTCVFGKSTLKMVEEIGKRITRETGDPRETAWLKQRLNIAVLRGNAQCILQACPQIYV